MALYSVLCDHRPECVAFSACWKSLYSDCVTAGSAAPCTTQHAGRLRQSIGGRCALDARVALTWLVGPSLGACGLSHGPRGVQATSRDGLSSQPMTQPCWQHRPRLFSTSKQSRKPAGAWLPTLATFNWSKSMIRSAGNRIPSAAKQDEERQTLTVNMT